MDQRHYPEEIDLQKYWLVLRRRWLIISGMAVSTAALAGASAYSEKPQYKAQGQLLVQSSRTGFLTGVGERIGSLESLKREGNPLDTQAVVVQSLPLIQEVIQKLNLRDAQGQLLDAEDLKLKVETVVGTDVLKVSYASGDPKQASAVVNELMKAYIASNVVTNRAEAKSAGEFIEQQLPRAQADLEIAAEVLQSFQNDNRIFALEKESLATVDTLKTLADQINQSRSQLAEVSAQQNLLDQRVDMPVEQAIDSASLSQLPSVQSALGDLQKIQTQLATERTRYRAGHPSVVALERQEAALKSVLQERIGNAVPGNDGVEASDLQMSTLRQKFTADAVQLQAQRLGLEQKVATLTQLQATYRDRASTIPNLVKNQDALERRLNIAKKTYETLRTRLQDIRVAESQTVGNARIIQEARAPKKAGSSKKPVYIGGGLAVGLMLGVAAAFLLDLIDRSLKSVKEAQSFFGYSLLGLIPRFKTHEAALPMDLSLTGISPRVVTATGPRSIIHEAYRMFQANLKFTSLDKKTRTILITSSISGEGKSEVAANLATTLAQSGKKVLLIDVNMRSPNQHHLWGMMNSMGLSNVIVDPDDLPQAIQEITQNLSLLTSGVMPPDPLTLLESEAMTHLMQKVSQQYDYVLLDGPSLVGMADAGILGKLADGVILVVRPGVVTSVGATAAKELLRRSNSNVLGIVANGVNLKQEPDSYFYYTSNNNTVGAEATTVSLV
ncbi:MAG: polysaccharide biosynthesis tyrosine autokinase [Alkalinema sp. RU_4_3]|nr:polysaccharide biosynthesis tyrosine autokinase [Alkalinema sp. RU_4_3]